MLMSILFILKTILFLNITKVEFNQIPILLITSLTTILVMAIIQQLNLKHKNKVILTFYSIISFIMFADAMYYSHFGSLPTISVLSQVNQLTAVGDSIKYLLNIRNIAMILDIPVLIFIYLYAKDKFKIIELPKIPKEIQTHIILTTLALVMIYTSTIGQIQSVIAQEPYFYHISDIRKNFGSSSRAEANSVFTEEDLEEIKNRTNLEEGKLTGIGKDKNLIVLQIEALQDFVINLDYNDQEITPNLNKLIKDKSSVYYDKYHQLLGRGNTSDAEFVSHNSFHPSMEETSYTKYENNTFYGLPLLLKDNGYTPWVMHGYKKEFWNREKAYKNQGFERFISEEDYKFKDTIGFGLKDGDFFDQNLEYLKELDKIDDNPFYSFMITLTSHTPFDMPKEYQTLDLLPEHEDKLLGNFLQSIHYTDKEIGRFIENLKEEGLYDDTVIAIYGDHFAISSAHEEDQKMMTELLGDHYDYDEMMKIPLVVHVPGEDINETISTTGSQIDFYPTMLNIMGYKNEKGLMLGRDLTNYKGYSYVAPQTYMLKGSFIDEDTLFVISRDGIFDHSKAYNIKTKEKIDIPQLRTIYEKAVDEINKSDFILKKNLLKDYIEKDGDIDLNNLSESKILNGEYIAEAHYNSLEELNDYYDKGYRLLSVDLEWTSDDKIILLKDWYWYYDNLFEKQKENPTLEEFKEMEMKDNQTQMSLEDLVEWMEDHKDAQIVLRTGVSNENIMVQAHKEYPGLIENGIVEIDHFEHYPGVTFNGFRKVILNPIKHEYKDAEILDFVSRHPHFGVILDKERANTSLPRELKEKGLPTYVDGPTGKFARTILKRKVEGFIVNPKKEKRIKLDKVSIFQNPHIVAHGGGQIGSKTYTNSLEALDNSYKKDIRLMEIDFEWTTDDELVCLHSWDGFLMGFFNQPVRQYSFEEFENFQMINGWHQLTPEGLDKWFAYHSDAYLVTDVKNRNVEALKKLKEEYPRLAEKTIPQIYQLDQYEKVKDLGYENIILTLYIIRSTDDEIVKFVENNQVFAVTMPVNRAKTDLLQRLTNSGTYVYTHTVNSPNLAQELEKLGVSGFYTDLLEN